MVLLKGDICMAVARGAKRRQTITIYFIISLLFYPFGVSDNIMGEDYIYLNNSVILFNFVQYFLSFKVPMIKINMFPIRSIIK